MLLQKQIPERYLSYFEDVYNLRRVQRRGQRRTRFLQRQLCPLQSTLLAWQLGLQTRRHVILRREQLRRAPSPVAFAHEFKQHHDEASPVVIRPAATAREHSAVTSDSRTQRWHTLTHQQPAKSHRPPYMAHGGSTGPATRHEGCFCHWPHKVHGILDAVHLVLEAAGGRRSETM